MKDEIKRIIESYTSDLDYFDIDEITNKIINLYTNSFNWIKLDIKNLPEGEVLAANFNEGTYGHKEKIIGYLYVDGDTVTCDSSELLENCTHYIDINKFDLK